MAEFKADYSLQFLRPNGEQLDVLDTDRVVDFTYTRSLNDVGTFELTLDASDSFVQFFNATDLLLNVYRRNRPMARLELDASYLTLAWKRLEDQESGEEYVLVSGASLEHLLTRRVVVPEDDPVNAGGFVTRQGSGDVVMRDFVLYQCVTPAVNMERAFTGLSCASVVGGYQQTFQRRSYDELLNVLKEVAQKSLVDFRIAYTGDASTSTMALEFQATTIGTDRTKTTNYPSSPYLLFDPRRKNLYAPALTIDRRNEKTFVYVTGQGLEDERVVFPVVNAQAAAASVWNRKEVVVDARNNEEADTDGYLSAGIDALNEQKVITRFDFQPDLAVARYNVNWFLGDRVTAQYAGHQEDIRVGKVTITLTDDEEISVELYNENVL